MQFPILHINRFKGTRKFTCPSHTEVNENEVSHTFCEVPVLSSGDCAGELPDRLCPLKIRS